jgi:hypothetical protein
MVKKKKHLQGSFFFTFFKHLRHGLKNPKKSDLDRPPR